MTNLKKEVDAHNVVYYRYNKKIIAAMIGNELHISLSALDNTQTLPEDIDNVDYRRGVADAIALMIGYCFDDNAYGHVYVDGRLEVFDDVIMVTQGAVAPLGGVTK